jgi:ABC-type lipoprotein export system ATPase subunit
MDTDTQTSESSSKVEPFNESPPKVDSIDAIVDVIDISRLTPSAATISTLPHQKKHGSTPVPFPKEYNNNSTSIQINKSSRPPIQLEWKDLSFEVKVKAAVPNGVRFPASLKYMFRKTERTILFPMSGHVSPGECLAIMGPSGAGKTSLLNVLAQRTKGKGQIMINGQNAGKSFRGLSAFVQQDDVLMANLKVKEALRYAALLRLGPEVSFKEKARRVRAVAEELGLVKCMDTYIGAPGIRKGISGGERKRLCIAIELLSEPSVLFLDEPTSGLDAKTALGKLF